MVREPHHERVVGVSKIKYLTVRPEPSRRAPNEFSHSLASEKVLDTFFEWLPSSDGWW